MLGPFVFIPLLALICVYAFLRGGKDERAVALICIAGTVATNLVIAPLSERYLDVDHGILFVDLAVLAGFTAVALQTRRYWPLWVAGLQLTTTFGHVFKAIDQDLLPQAYGASLQFWAYPILLILAIGTLRTRTSWCSSLESDTAAV